MTASVPPFPSGTSYADQMLRELYARVVAVEKVTGIGPRGPTGPPGQVPGAFGIDRMLPMRVANRFVGFVGNAMNGYLGIVPGAGPPMNPPLLVVTLPPPSIFVEAWAHIHTPFPVVRATDGTVQKFRLMIGEASQTVSAADLALRDTFARSFGSLQNMGDDGQFVPLDFTVLDQAPTVEKRGRLLTDPVSVYTGIEVTSGTGQRITSWPVGMAGQVHIKILYVHVPVVTETKRLTELTTNDLFVSPTTPRSLSF